MLVADMRVLSPYYKHSRGRGGGRGFYHFNSSLKSLDDQSNEGELGEACDIHRRKEKCIRLWRRNMKQETNLNTYAWVKT